MSYYEPSSLYALQEEKKYFDSLGDGDSGVENDWWGLLKTCQDCKLTVPELRDEIQGLKDEKYYLQAQKGFLHAQLENSLTMNNKLESEVTGLKYELRNKESENQELRNRVLRLEKEVTLKPEIPPPPPPPPPPKSLFTQLRRNIIRKSKRAASVPNINTLCAAAPGARLNNETLEAIKNKSYQLRPVRRNAPVVKRNLSGDENDGKQNIGQILARRISMGYSSFDDDNISIKSYSSIRGMISFKAGDKARFESHLQHEHEAYFGLEVLLAVSFIREEERKALVRAIAVGYNKSSQPQPRIDIKVALTTHKRERTDSFTDLEDRDNATASDFSFEDNEKIYGVPETILNCPQCPRTFINIFSLRRHEDLHRERNYSCESCGQRFSFLEDLKVHRDVHNSRVDDEEFKKNNLSDEMYVAKDNSDTPADSTQNNESQAPEQKNKTSNSYVRCKICLKVMKRESYAEHRAHHKDAKNHQCSFCNSRFRKQEHLLKHIQRCQRNNLSATSLQFSYREQTNYSCSICSKCFQNEDNLRCHMILHFPEGLKQNPPFKPVSYQCKFCSGNFREFSDLTAHMEEVHEAQIDNQESYYIPMK